MQIAPDAEELGRFTGLKTVTLIRRGLPETVGQGEPLTGGYRRRHPRQTNRLGGAARSGAERAEILVLDEQIACSTWAHGGEAHCARDAAQGRSTNLLFSATFTQDTANGEAMDF